MHVYYLAPNELNEFAVGIRFKIEVQFKILKEHFNCDATYISLNRKMSLLNKIRRCTPFFSFYKKIDVNKFKPNSIVYFRHAVIDHRLLKMLMQLKKNGCIIILEIPTYPYDAERCTFFGKMILYQEYVYRKLLNRYVSRIITYSKDSVIYGIKTINISNAICIDDDFEISSQEETTCINIVAVAAIAFWHGYDRVIQGIYEYYRNGGKRKIIFHMVGYGRDLEKYKELADRLSINDHVIFYGKKQGKELDDIYLKCKIGIDSLGRHRSGVFYNSSLKGKEYLLKGLPVVSGVETELDSRNDFKYYLRIPDDDTPVDINRVVEFYDEIYGNKNELEIRKEIRKFAIQNFSYEATFDKVLKYLDETVQKKNSNLEK